MKKSISFTIIGLLIAILITGLVSASVINVRTSPEHKINMRLVSNTGTLVDSKVVTTDSTGITSMTYSGTLSEIRVQVTITKNGEKILFHNFDDIDTSEDQYLQAIPGNISTNYKVDDEAAEAAALAAEEEAAAEAEAAAIAAAEAEEANQSITGKITGFFSTILDKLSFGSEDEEAEELDPVTEESATEDDEADDTESWFKYSYLIYGIIALVIIGGIVYFFMSRKGQSPGLKLFRHEDFDSNAVEINKDKTETPKFGDLDEKKLISAEKKIMEAQKEIESIKNKKNEISEAEKAYAEAKKKLAKLGGKVD